MSKSHQEKCVGVLLGTAAGDILGAGIEGVSRVTILRDYGEVRDFLDSGRGFGCYTDDTEMTLALSQSIVDCRGVDGKHCARTYARYYNPRRGYGSGAHAVLTALIRGSDYKQTGTLIFPDGSYGNGGAMRIAPVGVVYSRQNNMELKRAVFEAVRCTHVHPEGVDGALVQARAAALLTNIKNPGNFKPAIFLAELQKVSTCSILQEKIAYLQEVLRKNIPDDTAIRSLGNGIRSSEAVSCALLAVIKYYKNPEEAVIKSVNFGGDTDTIGAMTGALMGAMHGRSWIPARWLDNMENGQHGRDYMIKLGSQLAGIII